MKLILSLLVCCLIWPAYGSKDVTEPQPVQTVLNALTSQLHDITLPDGFNLFGEPVKHGFQGIINATTFGELDTATTFRDKLSHIMSPFDPSKRLVKAPAGLFSKPEYYTAVEIFDLVLKLTDFVSKRNPYAITYFKHFFQSGQLYQVNIPGLEKQPQRAMYFEELYKLFTAPVLDTKRLNSMNKLLRERYDAKIAEFKAKVTEEANNHSDSSADPLDVHLTDEESSSDSSTNTTRRRKQLEMVPLLQGDE